jgi:hypothetical protein
MGNSETFGVEKGHGKEIVAWLNKQAKLQNNKLEARLYNYEISTKNFGDFEMFSWMGDVQIARKMIIKASKRFKIKVIEGGYKPKEKLIRMKKFDFAKVKKAIKHRTVRICSVKFGNAQWEIQDEEDIKNYGKGI